MAAIFLSYRRDDSAGWVGRLSEALRRAFGRDAVFMDIDSLAAGDDFAEAIERTVASCDVLLAVIGPQWLRAAKADGIRRLDDEQDFVRLEIATALQRGVRVVPVLVGNARMPGVDELPDPLKALARRQAYELSDRRWDYDVQGLTKSLRGRGGRWRRTIWIGGGVGVLAAVVLGFVVMTTFDWTGRDKGMPPVTRPSQVDTPQQAVADANRHLLAAIGEIDQGRPSAALPKIREAEAVLDKGGSGGDDENVRLLRGYVYKTGAQAARGARDDATARTYADLAEKVFRSIEADAATGRISRTVLAGALNGLGNVLCLERGDCAAAVASYRRATDLEPDYVYAWHDMLLAQIELAEAGQMDENGMQRSLARLRELAPTSPLMTPERIAFLAGRVASLASRGATPNEPVSTR